MVEKWRKAPIYHHLTVIVRSRDSSVIRGSDFKTHTDTHTHTHTYTHIHPLISPPLFTGPNLKNAGSYLRAAVLSGLLSSSAAGGGEGVSLNL